MTLVAWAEATARGRLEVSLPRRWSHVQSVAARAEVLAVRLGVDAESLRVAAWLHDVGYAPDLAATGFHPLDGAQFLSREGVPARIVGLVAFHSGAAAEAEALGLGEELAEFIDERSLTRDLLWFADMTVGPDGQCVSFVDRMAEVRERYPADHYVSQALDVGMADREAAVMRARAWIERVGLADQV